MPLLLRIDGPAGLVTYDAETLLYQTPSFASEYEQGKVTQPNATLSIPEGIFGIDGGSLRTSGLEGAWRAEVRQDGLDGAVLLDGRIIRDGIEWDALPRNVVIKAVADAADEAKERLKAIRLNDLPPAEYAALTYRTINTLLPVDYVKRGDVQVRLLAKATNIRWYNLLSVVQQVISAAGLTGAPTETFDLNIEIDTEGAGPTRSTRPTADDLHICSLAGLASPVSVLGLTGSVSAYSRNSLTLPAWDGWTLVEGFCKLCGLTFDAVYAAFPSEEIELRFIPDRWAETAGLPAVDSLWDDKLFTVRRDPPKYGNLAVTSADGPKAPDLLTYGDRVSNVTVERADLDTVFIPPALATRGMDRWVFDFDGKPVGQNEIKVPFAVAGGALWGQDTLDTTQIGDPLYPVDLVEYAFWADAYVEGTDDERCYLGSIRPGSGSSKQMLLYRRVANPEVGQLPTTNETWMREAFRNYAISRVVLDVTEGRLNVDDLAQFVPGVLAAGVEVDGDPWLVERIERGTELRTLDVRLARPAFGAYPDSDQPYFTGAVTGLEAKYTDIEVGPEKEFVSIRWNPPAAASGRALLYDVQRFLFGSGGVWDDLLIGTVGSRAIDFDRDQGGSDGGESFALYRVRATYFERTGLPATYGPWTEVRAYI